MENLDRKVWTFEEDQILAQLIEKHGEKNWAFLSKQMLKYHGIRKNGKQCRERWNNHLNPSVSTSRWTAQEDKLLFDLHKIHGNKWAVIASFLNGRTDNSTKNHFYCIVRKNLRKFNKTLPENEKIKGSIVELLKDPSTSKILLKRPGHYYPRKSQSLSKSNSTTGSKRNSRVVSAQIDPDELKSSLKKLKNSKDKPRAVINVRRSSNDSGTFSKNLDYLQSCRSSLSKLEIASEGVLPSPLYLESYRASARSSAGCFFDSSYLYSSLWEQGPRTPTNFLRNDSRRESQQSNSKVLKERRESRNSSLKDERDLNQGSIFFSFPSKIPEYSPRNSFQFHRTPRSVPDTH